MPSRDGSGRCRDRGLFRESRIRAHIDQHVTGTSDNTDKLWALIQLELWLRTFIDTKSATPLVLDLASA
jgi:hypothetical protein